ncbi:sulfotransferase 1C2-like [Harmonia axyridis]|uniref:sulfotransferase 1C2-like n=1 Tax=Harmonia axyridis TaxID=115357 RepID=UPI001E27882C|nr:sulfotransferase 1C2-like [Harmonia axyridis]
MTDKMKYPYTFEDLTPEEKELAKKYLDRDLVRVSGTKFTTGRPVVKYGVELYNFKPRPDDVWLIGYPRSGTTMAQEILYLLGTDLDYKKAESTIMDLRFPFLESVLIRIGRAEEIYQKLLAEKRKPVTTEEIDSVPPHVRLAETKEKRFIKSHLTFSFFHPELLNVGCKVVYIVRNIKDCFVSNYFFPLKVEYEMRKEEHMHELLRVYMKNLSLWGNYFEGLKEAWERRNNKNLLFLFYEEVVADKKAAIKKISEFMGKKLTEDELDKLVDHVSVDNFKKNKSVNNDHMVNKGVFVKNEEFSFIRKGGSGGWREKFSKEMNDDFNEWIRTSLKEIPGFEIPECWRKAMDL